MGGFAEDGVGVEKKGSERMGGGAGLREVTPLGSKWRCSTSFLIERLEIHFVGRAHQFILAIDH